MTRMVMVQGGKTYTYDYTYYGDGREQGINAYGDAHGNSTSTYDANLNRKAVNLGQGDGQDRPETKSLVLDNDGHILKLTHDDGKSAINEVKDYAYALGNPVGEVGHGTDTETNTVKLDTENYSLVINLGADTPATAVTSYTTRAGDTLQGIASAVYGNPSLWFVIADANGLNAGEPIPAGRQLTIPNNIHQGTLTADTHKLYNANDIIGSSLPNLVTPPPPSHGGGCGSIIMIIIVVVIAVVVAWATAGAGLLLVNAALGTTYASLAAAASASLLATVAATAVAGAVVAAVGSIVQQGLFIALGYMKPGDFSWNAVGHAAITGAITGAATAVGAAAKAAEIAAKVGKGTAETATYLKVAAGALRVTAAASKQLLDNGKITSWTSLAGAALGGAKTDIAGANIGGVSTESLSGAVSANTLGYVTPWVQLTETYVRNDGKLTPTDWAGAVGQTLGNAVSSDTASPFQNAVNRLGVNLLVAGALSHYGKDAAQSYAENAIGQEVGQYLGDQLTRSFNGLFTPKVGTPAQRPATTAAPTTTAPTVADNYVMRRDDGQSTDAYGNPLAPLQVADSGAITTDVAPGLLAGSGDANANQTPSIESHPIAQNETYWSIARNQLIKAGGDPSDADIQRQVYALMQMNPGVDPRNFHVGDTITLISPNSGTTISAGTLADYNKSDAAYQNYREAQAQQAQAQEAMALRVAYADSGNVNVGGTSSTNTLSEIKDLYTPFEGYFAHQMRAASRAVSDPSSDWIDKTVNTVLGVAVAPLALVDMVGEAMFNAPNSAARAGQQIARATLASNTDTKVVSSLSAIVELTTAFNGLAGPFAGVGATTAPLTVEQRALQGFPGAEATAQARATYGMTGESAAADVAAATGKSPGTAIQTYYPPNSGFLGTPVPETLGEGYRFSRYGGSIDESGAFSDFGAFAAPEGVPYGMRALPPGSNMKPLSTYEVVKPISDVPSGPAAPWFGELGLGKQHQFPMTIQDMLDQNYIRLLNREIPKKP
jgi:LysM repeat protein